LPGDKKVVENYIKTKCGMDKYRELRRGEGLLARLRLYWFLLFGALRDIVKTEELERASDSQNESSALDEGVRADKSERLRKKVVDYLALIRYKEF